MSHYSRRSCRTKASGWAEKSDVSAGIRNKPPHKKNRRILQINIDKRIKLGFTTDTAEHTTTRRKSNNPANTIGMQGH